MTLPERLRYRYNAADFAEKAAEHAGVSGMDFHEWWHSTIPSTVIIKIMTAYALRQELGVFNMTDTEWNRLPIQVASVQDDRVFLVERWQDPPVPESYAISDTEPPRAIGHGDVIIVFVKDTIA